MTKPGRNDPCYCGSGKKYKKCHMAADKAVEEDNRKLDEAGKWLRQDFLKFARDERFAVPFATALPIYWNEYYSSENAEQMAQNEAFRFIDWFVFDYQHEGSPTLLSVYYQERYDDLSNHQQQVLDGWLNASPATAYELLGYEGQTLQVREYFTGQEYEVYEPAGHGPVQNGDLLLGRLVPVRDQLQFSTVAAYLPQDEIADLDEKMDEARKLDVQAYPDASHKEFMRRQGHLIIHHALEQAELKGRPPVAGKDPNRADELVRKAAMRMRRLQQHLP
jgi:hypothetical protein